MKKVRSYCLNNIFIVYLKNFPSLAVMGLGIYLWIISDDAPVWFSAFLFLLILGALIFFIKGVHDYYGYAERLFNKRIRMYKSMGRLEYIKYDRLNAVSLFEYNLIVGDYCLMGRGSGMIIFYDEPGVVCRSRHTVVYTNLGGSKSRMVVSVIVDNERYDLCDLPQTEKGNKQWETLCRIIGEKQGRLTTSQSINEFVSKNTAKPKPKLDDDD